MGIEEWMRLVYIIASAVLLANAVVSLWRLYRGPTNADRMLAVEFFTTSTLAIVLLFSAYFTLPALIDIALLFALLAALGTANFVVRHHSSQRKEPNDDG
ncbi:monovalent cation/H+ antiporter complex subunit F [Vreelandella zhaodongensis]|uniref:monovalent cation/H+ antiporter complex subunit F n=1 Tax=Vreelandella zhaodongensis TaxID=1176240 RepID=UPI003EB7A1B1